MVSDHQLQQTAYLQVTYEVQTFMLKSFFLFQVFIFSHTFPMIHVNFCFFLLFLPDVRRTFPILSHVGPIPDRPRSTSTP